MKVGSKDHIKVKRLKRALGIPLYQAIGILETLYQSAAQSADDGAIGKFCNSDIALELEWEGDPDKLIAALVEARLLDEHPEDRLVIHDWEDHAPTFLKDRLRKRKQRTCDQSGGVESDAPRTRNGNSGTPRNRDGKSPLTQPNPTQPNQLNPNHSSVDAPPVAGKTAAGVFKELTKATLSDDSALLVWYRWATSQSKPVIPDSEANLLRVFGAARKALEGDKPVALFAWVVSGQHWDRITAKHEDEARARLRRVQWGDPPARVGNGRDSPEDDEEQRRQEQLRQLAGRDTDHGQSAGGG